MLFCDYGGRSLDGNNEQVEGSGKDICVYRGPDQNGRDVDVAQMSISRRVDEETVAQTR